LTPFHDDVDVLLHRASSDAELNAACAAIHALLREATPVAREAEEAEGDRQLAEGLAISPHVAGRCLLDGRRTAAFVRGVLGATGSFDRATEVVYAGTGPFAPLALLLMDRVDLARVHFTLIDADERSAESVRSLLAHFGFEGPRVVCADATEYVHPRPIDVLVSETMQLALKREPFVAILRNLEPQLADGGMVVPERVTVDLMLIDAGLGPVAHVATLDVARETVVHVPPAPDCRLALFTTIRVFGEDVLLPNESGLTGPEILWQFSPGTRGITLACRYETGASPGFRCRAV